MDDYEVIQTCSIISTGKYKFTEIARITKTKAITANGFEFKRNGLNTLGIPNWQQYGNSGSYCLYLDTEELRNECKEYEHKAKVLRFYKNFEPTFEQKEQIYNLFNK